ncbi:unnamed protein product [Fraxinus pennsylvanica]|uniref:Uncharacterized protein n=1 Tax=Fraxinus pennsylvanica TaxID=56036 RepID=A0AAD2A214_9LAMI|nr:unnamed protein product [Fraxinus pennsylvanica]
MTTVGTKEDNHQSAEITQSDIKSHESSNCITKKEWFISLEKYDYDTRIDTAPKLLRSNESFRNCFDPLVVSIGPYHFGNPELKEFEQLKILFALKFCRTHGDQVSVEQLYDAVAKVGDSARKCYAEGSTERYNDEEFNRIMFLDALFVLYFMFLFPDHSRNVSSEADEDPEVQKAVKERLGKSYHLVLRDLFLLENQIPLLVLEVLMKLVFKEQKEKTVDGFIKKVLQLFTIEPPRGNLCTNNIAMKFLGKMTGCCSKSTPKTENPDSDEIQDHEELSNNLTLLQLVRKKLIWPLIKHDMKDINAFIKESNVRESYRSVQFLPLPLLWHKHFLLLIRTKPQKSEEETS